MSTKKNERFAELEGLRGVAAVAVTIHHYLLAFYPIIFFGFSGPYAVSQHMRFEDNLYGSPLTAIFSGTFAVAIFFVLSGFVLSIGYFSTGNMDIVKKLAAKRYLRLMLPALASIIIACALIKAGLSMTSQGAVITGSGWLHAAWHFTPSFHVAFLDGIYKIFFQSGGDAYNNPLWTMYYEFAGSFIVFGFLALFGNHKSRGVLYAAMLLTTFTTWYAGFIAGMILADLYAHGRITQIQRGWRVIPVVLLGLFLGGYPLNGSSGTVYQYITPPVIQQFLIHTVIIKWNIIYLTIGATIIVASVLMTTQLASVFRKNFISKLGKYTFSVYLVHVPILFTFTTFAFVVLKNKLGLGYHESAILAMVLSIPFIAIASVGFEKYVDSKSISFSSRVANIVIGFEKVPSQLTTIMQAPRKLLRSTKESYVKQPVSQEPIE